MKQLTKLLAQKNLFPELISKSGAVPGIKVDTGAKVLAGSTEEKITEGLDGLRERLLTYHKLVQGLQSGEVSIIFQINSQANYPFTLMLMR